MTHYTCADCGGSLCPACVRKLAGEQQCSYPAVWCSDCCALHRADPSGRSLGYTFGRPQGAYDPKSGTFQGFGFNQTRATVHYTKPDSPAFHLSPYVEAKVKYFRSKTSQELSGFCISSPDNPLCAIDFRLIPQRGTGGSTDSIKGELNGFLERCSTEGITPSQCMRIWTHTHPGDPNPSGGSSISDGDEKTFQTCFTPMDYMIMLISGTSSWYCRLSVRKPVKIDVKLPVSIDWTLPFPAANHEDWDREFTANVTNLHKNGKKGADHDYPSIDIYA